MRGIFPRKALGLIESFRRWIGHDFLLEKRRQHLSKLAVGSRLSSALLRERQPMFEAFDIYEKATNHRTRFPSKLDRELADLAAVAARFSRVAPTLNGDIERHHRHMILSPGFNSTYLEWKTAATFIVSNGAEISWLSPSHSGPEFIARAESCEFEVECKHVSHMITEFFGDDQAGALADCIIDIVSGHLLCGELSIDLLPEIADLSSSERLENVKRHLSGLTAGNLNVNVPKLFSISGTLHPTGTISVDASDWHRRMSDFNSSSARVYGFALARPPLAINPLVIQMSAPRRTGEILLNHLWDRKFKKAAEQCTGSRGAVLAIEWEGLEDADIFLESDGIQSLIHRTFDEYRHVAGIILRCNPSSKSSFGVVDFSTPAFIARSRVTHFPEVATIPKFDRPIQT